MVIQLIDKKLKGKCATKQIYRYNVRCGFQDWSAVPKGNNVNTIIFRPFLRRFTVIVTLLDVGNPRLNEAQPPTQSFPPA